MDIGIKILIDHSYTTSSIRIRVAASRKSRVFLFGRIVKIKNYCVCLFWCCVHTYVCRRHQVAQAAGLPEELVSKAKQSRSEKKARKAMSKLGKFCACLCGSVNAKWIQVAVFGLITSLALCFKMREFWIVFENETNALNSLEFGSRANRTSDRGRLKVDGNCWKLTDGRRTDCCYSTMYW